MYLCVSTENSFLHRVSCYSSIYILFSVLCLCRFLFISAFFFNIFFVEWIAFFRIYTHINIYVYTDIKSEQKIENEDEWNKLLQFFISPDVPSLYSSLFIYTTIIALSLYYSICSRYVRHLISSAERERKWDKRV